MGLRFDAAAARAATPMPQPEDVFLSWLVTRPAEADLAAAIDDEIRRLGHYQGSHPGPRRLAELFEALRASLAADRGTGLRQ